MYKKIVGNGKIRCECGNLLFRLEHGSYLAISGGVVCNDCGKEVFGTYKEKENEYGRREQKGE